MRTKRTSDGSDWRHRLKDAHEQIRREGNVPLVPPSEEIIRQMHDGRLPDPDSDEPTSPGRESRRSMDKVMSATEARVHFGEVMRDVSERDEIVIVERGGDPKVAIISVEKLDRLRQGQKNDEGTDWFERAMRSRERIRQAFGDQPIPDIDELFHEMREERDAQILANLRRR